MMSKTYFSMACSGSLQYNSALLCTLYDEKIKRIGIKGMRRIIMTKRAYVNWIVFLTERHGWLFQKRRHKCTEHGHALDSGTNSALCPMSIDLFHGHREIYSDLFFYSSYVYTFKAPSCFCLCCDNLPSFHAVQLSNPRLCTQRHHKSSTENKSI